MLPGEDRRRSPGLPSTGINVCAGYGVAGTRSPIARAGDSCPQDQTSVREGRRRTIPAVEAALVILVPEAEDLVRPFREAYDPSAAKGMPAHITINYPFLPGASPSSDLEDRLRALFSRFASFPFRLEGPAFFPEVLYLTPDPDGPFKDLAAHVWEAFPNSPPYSGEYSGTTPHLTVAQEDESHLLEYISADFRRRAEGMLPISSQARKVWLMDNRGGRWRKRTSFPLARRRPSGGSAD